VVEDSLDKRQDSVDPTEKEMKPSKSFDFLLVFMP